MLYGEQQAIERLGEFVRVGGFSSTSQGNFWPGVYIVTVWEATGEQFKKILSQKSSWERLNFMIIQSVDSDKKPHEAGVRSLCHEARWFSYLTPNFDGPSLFFLLSMYSVRLILPAFVYVFDHVWRRLPFA